MALLSDADQLEIAGRRERQSVAFDLAGVDWRACCG